MENCTIQFNDDNFIVKVVFDGEWLITPADAPVRNVNWSYVHADYDGDEDGRCGFGASIEDCLVQIKEFWG